LEHVVDKEVSSQQQIAIRIAESATQIEREAMKVWLRGLLDIRSSNISSLAKAKKALGITVANKVLWPMIKLIYREIKRYAWDNRSAKVRRSYAGVALALATVGGQSAGIAAMGGAIAVPLWVVFGAGAAFAPILLRAFFETDQPPSSLKTTYTVINGEKE
jgi:hypothetical protein